MKYFNSSLVADFIINKTLGIDNKRKYFGMINERNLFSVQIELEIYYFL